MHDPWYGCGPGRRRGRRACRGWSGFDNEYGLTGFRSNRQQEQATLKDRAEYLESVLNRIKKRVADLEGETESG